MLDLVDSSFPDFRYTRFGYQAEVQSLAIDHMEFLASYDQDADDIQTPFSRLYDAVTSSPWMIYTTGTLAILIHSDARYPEVLSIRDSAIWCFLVDVASYCDKNGDFFYDAKSDTLESLDMLHDDFFSRNGYRYAY